LLLVSVHLSVACADDGREKDNASKAAELHDADAGNNRSMQLPTSDVAGKIAEKQEKGIGNDKIETNKEEALDDELNDDLEEEIGQDLPENMPDPLKPFNRLMFQFNDKLYFYALKPIARVYKFVLPEPVRLSVRNAISNITMPIRLVNCLLQGKMKGAGIELSRFMINSTFGVLGLFDVAKKDDNLDKQDEDFGQTLGHYGLKEGFYIVWPVFGPSTVRDTIGMLGDYFSNPVLYLNPTSELAGINVNRDNPTVVGATDKVNKISLNLGVYEEFKESSIDPYISMRNAYLENRRNKIKQ
jgi:phospholipid-binding lipoprotein MlaA